MSVREIVVIAALCLIPSAQAQTPSQSNVLPPLHPPIDFTVIDTEIEANIERLGLQRVALASPNDLRADFNRLIFPVRAASNADVFRMHHTSNYVDLAPVSPGALLDYACGARTYDLSSGYNHAGMDIVLTPFRGHAMDQGWGEVVAAAAGVIVARNHLAEDRNCGGVNASPDANYVTLLQDDGITAYYFHMSVDSLTDKQVGDRVEAGEFLGRVGSSGLSAEPHLHFELRHPDIPGTVVDPNAGRCGASTSMWRHQPAYIDRVITALYSHDFYPVVPDSFCSPELPRFRSVFSPGDMVYLGLYMRDQEVGAAATVSVTNPAGNEVFRQTSGVGIWFSPRAEFPTSFQLPDDAPAGQWIIRGEYQGDLRERAFYVGSSPASGARLASAVLPGSRSVQVGQTATVFATVLNPSEVEASGCWISPAAPIDGRFEYRETSPVTNAVIGDRNAVFDIPASGSRSFVISITPADGSVADSLDLSLRYKCDNSDAANIVPGVNSILLSFGPQPVPDLIAISLTPSGDGILRISDENSAAAFATAVSNVGAAGTLTVRPAATGGATSMRLRICETDSATGACLSPASETISRDFASNETASFAIFGRAQGEAVAFAPATTRIQLIAEDAAGIVRGSTSVAVRTN
jgi:Peptidase family M23